MASFRLEESRQESKNASIVKVARKVWEKHRLWDTAVSQSVVSEHILNKLDKKSGALQVCTHSGLNENESL